MTETKNKSRYDKKKQTSDAFARKVSAEGRDIGSIPAVVNPERREECRLDLFKFGMTYNPEAFGLESGQIHRDCVARLQESVLDGALYAFAMPRGSGKTTWCRTAAFWAASYAHWRYPFLIGSTEQKALDSLDAIKIWMRFLPLYAEDFPEISFPIQKLEGIAHRCNGQTCCGHPTSIQWNKNRIVLPTVKKPDGTFYETSGTIIGVSGLTGEGIRGSLFTTSTGEQLRPDGVLLDDPQTDASAHSPSQNETRTKLVNGAVLGMAGPGKRISAVMPCTVIANEDMVDRILDRSKNPLWRGERTKMLKSFPEDMDAWEKYFEVYRNGMLAEPPSQDLANEYYIEHRDVLDAGAESSWESRKDDCDVSAIQHAMHLYCRDPDTFMAEYQNEPPSDSGQSVRVTSDILEKKPKPLERYVVPEGTSCITAFIDVSEKVLWYTVIAYKKDFTSYIVDYGVWPEQATKYTTLTTARKTLKSMAGGSSSLEVILTKGLDSLMEHIGSREYFSESNVPHKLNMAMIDSGWGASTETVYNFCRRSRFSNILLPTKGEGITAGRNMLVDPSVKRKPSESIAGQWRVAATAKGVRLCRYDTNYNKSFTLSRLADDYGSPGSMTLYKGSFGDHRMIIEQLTSEYSVKTEGRGRVVDEFHLRPGRDNHLLDCVVGCNVAASIMGCSVSRTLEIAKQRKKANKASKKRKNLQTNF